MYNLIVTPPDEITSELSAVMQCYAINSLVSSKISSEQEILLTGIIYLHEKECVDKNCPINCLEDLYDPLTNRSANEENLKDLHKNQVYLKHFSKFYFDTAILRYPNSPDVHIAYAFFLFYTIRNINGALVELKLAKKSSPNLMQSFVIFS